MSTFWPVSEFRALAGTVADWADCEIEEPLGDVLSVPSMLAGLAPYQPVAENLV